ncbi:MAG TPA: alkaline phosphatase D family protein, partial [Kiritimatiellia bacterium]
FLATWDDHDYGANDGGADFAERAASRDIFLDFWEIPADAPRRGHDGVYDVQMFGPPGKRVQVILLDTRYFRSPLARDPDLSPDQGRYKPSDDPAATMLGDEQWKWLEAQLREPADLRLLVSSIQVLSDEHHFEKWGNLPRERQRLLDLLRDTKAAGVIILSGDRHRAEISLLNEGVPYPLYDVTASALNMSHPIDKPEPNSLRQGELVMDNNFGLLTIDWNKADPEINIQLRDLSDKVRVESSASLKVLR